MERIAFPETHSVLYEGKSQYRIDDMSAYFVCDKLVTKDRKENFIKNLDKPLFVSPEELKENAV